MRKSGLEKHFKHKIGENLQWLLRAALYWSDKVYMDHNLCYMATSKLNSNLLTFSERFEQRYSKDGYVLDNLKRVRPGPDTPVVEYQHLVELLKS